MQTFEAQFYHGKKANAVNIIGAINPEKKKRILLCAHWDSRFHADQDTKRKNEPILGADDGASGVAVLLEIARVIQKNPLDIGVDIIFFDAEDQGHSTTKNIDTKNTWCLGAQHWGKKPHIPNYSASFGILLDMVGSKNARFAKEGYSLQYAPKLTHKVWKLAQEKGSGSYFVNEKTGSITDDHYFVNKLTGIPTIDIINRTAEGHFGDYWHTHKDNIDVISKRTLGAVGNVVLEILYQTAEGKF